MKHFISKKKIENIYLIWIKSEYTCIRSQKKGKKKINNSFECKLNSGFSVLMKKNQLLLRWLEAKLFSSS